MNTIDSSKWKIVSKDSFVKECFEGFGKMNKNDYEVAMFHLLLQNGLSECSDFEISKTLKIPETKVKRLRYEVGLVYGESDETLLDGKLIELLSNSSFKLTIDRIQFSIPDRMLRLYLNDKLQKKNHFADSSFNSNIVSITAHDLDILLDQDTITKDKKKEIINKIKEKVKESTKELPKSASEKIWGFTKNVMTVIGGKALEKIVDDSMTDIMNYYKDNHNK